MTKHQVNKAHEPEAAERFVVSKGDQVGYERKPTIWAGWVWCTTSDGKSAWVPESWLNLQGNQGVFIRDYDSRELPVKEGDVVDVELEAAGWVWVKSEKYGAGWIPMDCLDSNG
jgi:hypothetical protein